MKTDMDALHAHERPAWPIRPWILGALGVVAGLAIHFLIGERFDPAGMSLPRLSFALFLASATTLIGFTLERVRWPWAIAFSAASGAAIALILYFNGSPSDWSDVENWRFLSIFLSVAIAAPLFQAARDEGALQFPYGETHDHAFTNVVIWIGAWIFVGIVFLLALLLSELFALIKITLLKDLLDEKWFWRPLLGGAFGTAIGVLREQDRIVRLIQRVIVAVLAVLAPILAVGLVLFLLSLPFTGLSALWDATRSTTPILLSCIIGGLILANGVIGNGEETRMRPKALSYAATALGAAVLPLAAIALVSTLLRIKQYGYTPDRLWAITFIVIAIAYGAVYLGTILWKRRAWMDAIRPSNLKLAIGLCAMALVLALPVINFNALSVQDQVARLRSGKVTPKKFDWEALRYDFGEPGRNALEKLAKARAVKIRNEAILALKAESRWELHDRGTRRANAERAATTIRVKPHQIALPAGLLETFDLAGGPEAVSGLYYREGDTEALLVSRSCDRCEVTVSRSRLLPDGRWERRAEGEGPMPELDKRDLKAEADAIRKGDFTVKTVTRKQIFLNGKPVGQAFD